MNIKWGETVPISIQCLSHGNQYTCVTCKYIYSWNWNRHRYWNKKSEKWIQCPAWATNKLDEHLALLSIAWTAAKVCKSFYWRTQFVPFELQNLKLTMADKSNNKNHRRTRWWNMVKHGATKAHVGQDLWLKDSHGTMQGSHWGIWELAGFVQVPTWVLQQFGGKITNHWCQM